MQNRSRLLYMIVAVAVVSTACYGQLKRGKTKPTKKMVKPLNVGQLGAAGSRQAGPSRFELGLESLPPSKVLPAEKIVSPGGRIQDAGVVKAVDPGKKQRTGRAASYTSDLSGETAKTNWDHRTFVLRPEVIRNRLPDLPPVIIQFEFVEALRPGHYRVHFTYGTSRPEELDSLVIFELALEGEAAEHAGYQPWIHIEGAGRQFYGRIDVFVVGNEAPIRVNSDAMTITARELNGQQVGNVRIGADRTWYKRYADITRNNIRQYIEGPATLRDSITLPGLDHLMRRSAFRYAPAMLLFKTSRGNYVKALVRPERDSTDEPWHLRIDSLYTYAKNRREFLQTPGGSAADRGFVVNEEYMTKWDGGGYLFNLWQFDLDWAGAFGRTEPQQAEDTDAKKPLKHVAGKLKPGILKKLPKVVKPAKKHRRQERVVLPQLVIPETLVGSADLWMKQAGDTQILTCRHGAKLTW